MDPFTAVLLYGALFVLAELLRPKPNIENAKPAGLGDFQFPTATEGRPVPILWGTVRQKGPNVVWYGDFEQVPMVVEVKTGLFSKEDQITGFKYQLGVQFALCRGPVDSLERLWIGDVEIDIGGPIAHDDTFLIDCPELFGGDKLGTGGVQGTLKFHSGAMDQAVSTYLSGYQLEGGDTPRYIGTCYIAPAFANTYLGNSTSIKPWAFEVKRLPNGLALPGDGSVNTYDANPANVLYEIMTNTEWGLGFAPASISAANFYAVGEVLDDEGNGFSYMLDKVMKAEDLIRLVEEQIHGTVYQDRSDGLWKIKLARFDYDINTVPEITEANMVNLVSFSRGSWDGTTNQVRIEFNDRADDYAVSYGLAQDSANIRTMQGTKVSATQNFPGVKDADLANFIAWRQLRTLSNPLIKITVELDRTFYAVVPGDVLAFTNDELGLDKLPMRVGKINYGEIGAGSIRVEMVQDVFTSAGPSFAAPFGSRWVAPVDVLDPFDAAEQLAMEAPRAFVIRDPATSGIQSKVWCGARRIGNEVGFKIRQRNAAGVPSGAYADAGESYRLLLIGELNGSLAIGSAWPLTTLVMAPSPDVQADLEDIFTDAAGPGELGTELVNLILVNPGGANEEFMLVTSAETSGANVQLNNVYRGMLDTVQAAHSAGEEVWLLFAGGSMTTSSFTGTNNVDIKLLPFSSTNEVAEASATTIAIALDDRARRPYPPHFLELNSTDWAASTSMEANGSDAEDYAIDLAFRRRDYRTTDEVQSITDDAAVIDPSFPSANSTTHSVAVRNDPSGANTLLFTETGVAGTQVDILRLRILQATDGALPTTLRFEITAVHVDGGTSFDSMRALVHDFAVTSALTGQFEFTALDNSDVSALYTATTNGTYNFDLSSAFTGGAVQYRLNGGAWTSLIAAGLTTGSIAGVVATDTIEVRHTSTDIDALKQLDMTAPGAGQDAFAVLFT
jgi:hypothetical protein